MPPLPPSDPRRADAAAHRQRLILWLVMALSIVMYFAVVQVARPADAHQNPTLVNVLLAAAIALVAASFPIKSRLLARTASSDNPSQVKQAALLVSLVFCEAAALCGVVVWFTTGSPRYYIFLLLGLVGQLAHYPGLENES